ncbi:tyrosine-type recombinase/integrase [Streptomyces sp. NPDC001848]|uniref:tyrosine-type recombinase/integrase n=1 Tax=Streptomyces sp. NPDC001848 TaxID=3364618 RepID=UPI0036C491EE
MEPRNFTREFDRRCERAGVRRIRVHDTRHTCASLLAALDVHPRIAMQILRHSEIAVTMEVYTHVPSAETRRALRKLGKALGGSKQKDGKKKGKRKQEEPPDKDGRQEP